MLFKEIGEKKCSMWKKRKKKKKNTKKNIYSFQAHWKQALILEQLEQDTLNGVADPILEKAINVRSYAPIHEMEPLVT